MSGIVIVGAGLAGATAATELRERGYDGALTLIGEEPHVPYERPPLSKDLLLGKSEADAASVHGRDWYADHDVDLRTDVAVTAIDTANRRVTIGGEEELTYDQLVLATGARARHLAMADNSGASVVYLRTLDDAQRLKDRLTDHVLIIGAGWIGLEVAAAVRMAGGRATVVESADLPLGRVLGPEIAPVFADLHREHGVDLRLGTTVEAITSDGETTVRLGDGEELHPDLILVGIGAEPNVALAEDAGLDVDHGVLVDGHLRTSDPHVFAIGDIANQDHPVFGRIRVEHWDTALQHGRYVAGALLGDPEPYRRPPFFFTDQYDLGMEYVGHAGVGSYDEVVVRGDLAARKFNALWLNDGRVVAGMHAGDWDATKHLKAWLGHEATGQLRDTGRPLDQLDEPTE
ncbi:FAD-dependent oxidoreductase [Ammonicoccus fulvus]|uniref:FAD-dependent oxidoreductase n=1 Tax=Ammonicoccus fulvus TaxID=3138240 RepID=A0ABZ3FJR4_9ACTN